MDSSHDRFGQPPHDSLKAVVERSILHLLAVLVTCLEPDTVRRNNAEWIARMLRDVITDLEGEVERIGT